MSISDVFILVIVGCAFIAALAVVASLINQNRK